MSERYTPEAEERTPVRMRILIRYHDHTVPNNKHYDKMKGQLKHSLRNTFVKGQRNIYFGEDADGLTGRNLVFKKEFVRTGSYRKASMYTMLDQMGIEGATDIQVDKIVKQRKQELFKTQEGGLKYRWMEAEVVDELSAEGYKIQVEHEEGEMSEDLAKIFHRPQMVPEDTKRYVSAIVPWVIEREKRIFEQVNMLGNGIEQTNVHLMLGSMHYFTVPYSMPERFQPITQLLAYIPPISQAEIDVISSLAATGAVSRELLRQAYGD